MTELLKIHARDNVAVSLADLEKGQRLSVDGFEVETAEEVARGHKVALVPIKAGEPIVKYGFPIGVATQDIASGETVHTQNLKTALGGLETYTYTPGAKNDAHELAKDLPKTFPGYVREDGRVGVRNELWIVNTVGCVNKTAEILAKEANARYTDGIDGVFAFPHPYGCSQMGDDHKTTQIILADMVKHPNAGGVLVLGLGCENNNIPEFKKVLGDLPPERVRFLSTQEAEDEIEEGLKLLGELYQYAKGFKRQPCPVSSLTVGLKCGGSDGFSGITANPLLGAFSDRLVALGGISLLTEVPEMFGAETILMDRCSNEGIFDKTVKLINDFKDYYIRHDQVVYENPSPGNKKGGISTLEEKSLGCTQKGGTSPVVDVLGYGEPAVKPGLNLLQGPGNDIVAVTALMASGAQIILFTTGRGTPLGSPVPTVKVSTNSELAARKSNWIDFDAGPLVRGTSMDALADDFFRDIISYASGDKKTLNEQNGYREIAIFKDGVTL